MNFNHKENTDIHDLQVYLHGQNQYDLKILGTYTDVNPEKDQKGIMSDILNKQLKNLSETLKEFKKQQQVQLYQSKDPK